MKKHFSKGVVIALILTFTACSSNGQDSKSEEKTTQANKPTPTAATAPHAAAQGELKGKIHESMNSGGYTYIQLDTGAAQPWIAIPASNVKVGDEVSCAPGMVMTNFTSKTLNKTFDTIIFSAGLVGGASAGSKGGMANPHKAPQNADDSFANAVKAEGGQPVAQQQPQAGSGGSLGAMAPFSEVTVEKASGENGYTIEEVFTKTTDLDGKTVRIQGKVVKFSPMIMGRNWIHLQDGTGDPMSNTHDLVVTTSETIEPDTVITIEGVLAANKDFGAGYKYVAIVEEAKTVQ